MDEVGFESKSIYFHRKPEKEYGMTTAYVLLGKLYSSTSGSQAVDCIPSPMPFILRLWRFFF